MLGRAGVALLLVGVSVTVGGCIHCNTEERQAAWYQDAISPVNHSFGVEYKLDDMWGNLGYLDEPTHLILNVYRHGSAVSHDDMVSFANSLFESKGWPPPQLEGAKEWSGCGDSW